MADYLNYVQDMNKFSLAGPPSWFKRQLWEYDPSLMIVPSRMGFFYRLGQKRKLKLPEKIVNDVLKEQADTQMLASYSLIPVTTILATVDWGNPIFFHELNRRAPWRMGGAKKFTDLIEDQEKREAMDANARQNEQLDYLAKDAWRFYNKQIGTRSHLWSPTTKSSGSRTAKSHGLIIPGSKYQPAVKTAWGDVLRKG